MSAKPSRVTEGQVQLDLVTIKLSLTNQDGGALVEAKAEVEVPIRQRG